MSTSQKIDWYRCSIPKEKLQELTQRSDLPGLAAALGQLGLYVITGTAAYMSYRYLHWSVFVAALYIHCMLVNFFYSPIHEMVHTTPFKTKWINEIFLKIFAFLICANPFFIRTSHMHHHRVTEYKGLDFEVPPPRIYQTWHWFFYWTFMPFNLCLVPGFFPTVKATFRLALGRLEGDLEKTIFTDSNPADLRRTVNWARFTIAAHIVLIALFLYFGLWPLILIINFPVFFGAALGQLLGMTQHTALIHSVPDFRLSCRTMHVNPFLRFLYWNMNYHIEHHMYAAVPFYRLPDLHETIKPELPPTPRGLWAVWVKEMIPAMKKMRKDPEYCIVPDVPNPKMK